MWCEFKKYSSRGVLLKKRPQACNFIKKETLAQVFCYEFCKISKNTFSYRTPLVATSWVLTGIFCMKKTKHFLNQLTLSTHAANLAHYFRNSMRKKCPNTEFFLLHIFPYSVEMRENTDQKNFVFAHFSRSVNDNFEREPEEHLKLSQTYVTEVFVKIIYIENFLQKVPP